ncbi:hypothetical protein ACQ33O_08935 [Ferruginibacter sp. SUN002]|uniref:hypothetical protein n=1 Tax=Ferruginibacter sp. SUN002 TaxID=2937789 RepID=UPI003D361609
MKLLKKLKTQQMKALKTTIAILVLTIAANASFAQNSVGNIKNVFENKVGVHNCAKTQFATAASLEVCPMQMAEGIVVLKLTNQPLGKYSVSIKDENGVVVMTQNVNYDATATAQTVKFGKALAGGTYTIDVVRPDNTRKSETVLLWL